MTQRIVQSIRSASHLGSILDVATLRLRPPHRLRLPRCGMTRLISQNWRRASCLKAECLFIQSLLGAPMQFGTAIYGGLLDCQRRGGVHPRSRRQTGPESEADRCCRYLGISGSQKGGAPKAKVSLRGLMKEVENGVVWHSPDPIETSPVVWLQKRSEKVEKRFRNPHRCQRGASPLAGFCRTRPGGARHGIPITGPRNHLQSLNRPTARAIHSGTETPGIPAGRGKRWCRDV